MSRKTLLFIVGLIVCLYSSGQPGNTKIPYDKILENFKQIVSKDWLVFKDSANVIHIKQLDSIEICNFINAEKYNDLSWEDYIKNKIVGKIKYEMEIKIVDKLAGAELKSIADRNDSINSALFYLPAKYHIENLSHKYDDYLYNSETERQNVLKYKEESKKLTALYQKLPDYSTKLYSVCVSDNLPWWASFCRPETDIAIDNIKKKTEEYMMTLD